MDGRSPEAVRNVLSPSCHTTSPAYPDGFEKVGEVPGGAGGRLTAWSWGGTLGRCLCVHGCGGDKGKGRHFQDFVLYSFQSRVCAPWIAILEVPRHHMSTHQPQQLLSTRAPSAKKSRRVVRPGHRSKDSHSITFIRSVPNALEKRLSASVGELANRPGGC